MRKTRDESGKKLTMENQIFQLTKGNVTIKKVREAEINITWIFLARKNGILSMWKIIGRTLNPNKDKSRSTINRLLIDRKNI